MGLATRRPMDEDIACRQRPGLGNDRDIFGYRCGHELCEMVDRHKWHRGSPSMEIDRWRTLEPG